MTRRLSQDTLQGLGKRCQAFIQMSRNKQAKRVDQWNRNEEQFAAYMPAHDAEPRAEEPQYRTLFIPYSYAIAMTAHTYYTSVFMSRSPVLQVAGRHGEGEMQVQAMEAILDYQLQVGEMLVPLFLWLFDPIKYGHGFIGTYWDEETVRCRRWVTRPKTFMGIELSGTEERVEEVTDVVGYTGHRCYNIRPHDAFPDPRVSVWNFQKGQFFGRYVELTDEELAAGERAGVYFDVKELRRDSYAESRSESSVADLPGEAEPSEWPFNRGETPGFLKAYEVFVKCVPREWGLADSDRQEIWVITLTAGDYRVFGVRPLGEYHGKFPIDVLMQEPDAYNTFARSMMEVMEPLNETITWLVNSHMYNVRSALNNQFLVDPSMVVMKDLENPNPGKLIRLKPQAYGRDVRTFFSQLAVHDVTAQHIPNMHLMSDILQRITGVTDNIMGMVNTGGRKTATEVRQSTTFGINRLKTTCEFFSMAGFAPFTQKLIQGTQQHYNAERKLRVVGELGMFSERFINVTPQTIAGFYDFVPVDGSMPVDRFAQANLWNTMISQAMRAPQIAAQYDLGKIFGWVASLAGLKNVQQFKVQVADPAMLDQQAQAGNVVPLDRDFGRPPDQMQLPGMGATM